jgi:uncharacterized protein with von Willebrand factor type A (vWA) domain
VSGHLLTHLLSFGYLLREMGVAVSPGQMVELTAALEYVPISSREDFYAAARCLLVLRHEDLSLFDTAFDFFWRNLAGGDIDDELMKQILHTTRVQQRRLRLRQRPDAGRDGSSEEGEEKQELLNMVLTYSASETLRQKDFGQFSWEEVQACKELLRRLAWRIAERPTRRKRPAANGRQLDMRRTLRQNMRYGGEPLLLARRETRTRRRPLVVLCDISGSMERYSRILLQFVHTISNGLHDVEAFVFGTRLTRITRQLRQRDIDDAVENVAKHVFDWSGGTRIGEAIKEFNFQWGRRVLHHGPVVLLISDGWDRGEPELLGRELDRLQRSCYRLIWLNPLLGDANYQPLTLGMQAALPHIDDFLPVNNLASLEQLGEKLSALGVRRPERRQSVNHQGAVGTATAS